MLPLLLPLLTNQTPLHFQFFEKNVVADLNVQFPAVPELCQLHAITDSAGEIW